MPLLWACGLAAGPNSSSATPSTASGPNPASTAHLATAAPSKLSAGVTTVSAPASPGGDAQPKYGGTLRFAIPSDLATLDAHGARANAGDSIWLVYDRLIEYDDKLVPQPMLAENWDLRADYKSIVFHLRKGVTFHNGRELTSDDVKYNLLRVRDPKLSFGIYAAQSSWWTGIDTPDKYTVVLTSDISRPALFDFFDTFNILDKDTMEGPDARNKAVGTGPFVFKEWVQGDHLSFVKNRNYWQAGRPYLDGWVTQVRSPQTAVLQLEAGALDALRNPSVPDIVRLQSNPNYVRVAQPYAGMIFQLGVGVYSPPLDNKLVRQALSYAFNRQRLAEQALAGLADPHSLPWTKTSPAYDATKNNTYAFSLERAKELLKQANITSLNLDVMIAGGAYPAHEGFLQAYQADLASIGVKLNIKPVPTAAFVNSANSRNYNGLAASPDVGANLHPATMLTQSPAWRAFPNNGGFDTPEWKDIVTQVSTEPDPAKQKALFGRMNDYILDQSWMIVASGVPYSNLTRSNVHGMEPTQHASFSYTHTWLD
jgi:peptide/nickel transport system substrate-binding protein